jgi:hypothetical protein
MRSFVLAAVLLSVPALAQDCPIPESAKAGGLAHRPAAERLKFLSSVIASESARARRWTLGWGGAYGLLTLAQLAVVPAVGAQDAVDWYVGAFTTVVGVAFILFDPLEVIDAGPGFAARVEHATPQNTCALLAEAERLVKEGAQHEAFNTAWYSHLSNVLFNAGVGLFLWLAYGRLASGLVNFGLGTALGEATLFDQPTGLQDAWEAYQQGAQTALHLQVAPALGPNLVGVRLAVTF